MKNKLQRYADSQKQTGETSGCDVQFCEWLKTFREGELINECTIKMVTIFGEENGCRKT